MPFTIDWLWLIVGIAVGLMIHGLLINDKVPVSYPTKVGY